MTTLISSGLLLGSMSAYAQYERPRYYQEREHGRMLDGVRADLDRAADATPPFTADRNRVVAARERVAAFERRLADGDYDNRDLDNAIASIQRVVDLNRMSDWMRDRLVDDLARLRDMRERSEHEWR